MGNFSLNDLKLGNENETVCHPATTEFSSQDLTIYAQTLFIIQMDALNIDGCMLNLVHFSSNVLSKKAQYVPMKAKEP